MSSYYHIHNHIYYIKSSYLHVLLNLWLFSFHLIVFLLYELIYDFLMHLYKHICNYIIWKGIVQIHCEQGWDRFTLIRLFRIIAHRTTKILYLNTNRISLKIYIKIPKQHSRTHLSSLLFHEYFTIGHIPSDQYGQ